MKNAGAVLPTMQGKQKVGTAFPNQCLIEIQRIAINFSSISASPFLCLLKFFFQDAIAIFHRIQFLREDLLALLLLLIQTFDHFREGRQGLGLLFVSQEGARRRVNGQRCLATGTDNGEPGTVCHQIYSPRKNLRQLQVGQLQGSITPGRFPERVYSSRLRWSVPANDE
jgi:hypothetical protein